MHVPGGHEKRSGAIDLGGIGSIGQQNTRGASATGASKTFNSATPKGQRSYCFALA